MMIEADFRNDRLVRAWIITLLAMVFLIVTVGGITRLTRSGLSIVEWNLLMGVLPPVGETRWMEEFAKYQAFPEYQKVNFGMTLQDFKFIYFWEWFHRLLGRLIGLTAFIPLMFLQISKRISKPVALRMWGAFLLICLQGAMGWFMVMSGLVDQPRVSHFRLAAHLSLAFLLAGYLVWIYLDLRHGGRFRLEGWHAKGALVILFVVSLQVVYGAFVAGLRAGYGFNTFPLMNGELFPAGFFREDGGAFFSNVLHNTISVQFIHRMLGWLILLGVGLIWVRERRMLQTCRARSTLDALTGAVVLQFGLGVATLILVVPVALATMHQVVACALFCLAVAHLHAVSRHAGRTPSAR